MSLVGGALLAEIDLREFMLDHLRRRIRHIRQGPGGLRWRHPLLRLEDMSVKGQCLFEMAIALLTDLRQPESSIPSRWARLPVDRLAQVEVLRGYGVAFRVALLRSTGG